jgi:hypothetical protein
MQTTQAETKTESDIWTRLIQPRNGSLAKSAARALLAINFSETDKARMLELAEKNNEGKLTPAERKELKNYVKIGDILSLLHMKARRSLKR